MSSEFFHLLGLEALSFWSPFLLQARFTRVLFRRPISLSNTNSIFPLVKSLIPFFLCAAHRHFRSVRNAPCFVVDRSPSFSVQPVAFPNASLALRFCPPRPFRAPLGVALFSGYLRLRSFCRLILCSANTLIVGEKALN